METHVMIGKYWCTVIMCHHVAANCSKGKQIQRDDPDIFFSGLNDGCVKFEIKTSKKGDYKTTGEMQMTSVPECWIY